MGYLCIHRGAGQILEGELECIALTPSAALTHHVLLCKAMGLEGYIPKELSRLTYCVHREHFKGDSFAQEQLKELPMEGVPKPQAMDQYQSMAY